MLQAPPLKGALLYVNLLNPHKTKARINLEETLTLWHYIFFFFSQMDSIFTVFRTDSKLGMPTICGTAFQGREAPYLMKGGEHVDYIYELSIMCCVGRIIIDCFIIFTYFSKGLSWVFAAARRAFSSCG